jgi:hypothetical protein
VPSQRPPIPHPGPSTRSLHSPSFRFDPCSMPALLRYVRTLSVWQDLARSGRRFNRIVIRCGSQPRRLSDAHPAAPWHSRARTCDRSAGLPGPRGRARREACPGGAGSDLLRARGMSSGVLRTAQKQSERPGGPRGAVFRTVPLDICVPNISLRMGLIRPTRRAPVGADPAGRTGQALGEKRGPHRPGFGHFEEMSAGDREIPLCFQDYLPGYNGRESQEKLRCSARRYTCSPSSASAWG